MTRLPRSRLQEQAQDSRKSQSLSGEDTAQQVAQDTSESFHL